MASEPPEREGVAAAAAAPAPGPGPGLGSSTANPPAAAAPATEEGAECLSPLEQEVLDEYARLLGNLNTMSSLLLDLSNAPSAAILDGLRGLERKTSLVFTLLKASVYSIVLNQQITDDGAGAGGAGAGEEGGEGGAVYGLGTAGEGGFRGPG